MVKMVQALRHIVTIITIKARYPAFLFREILENCHQHRQFSEE